ncbi:protease inhibitor I42 family protein [Kitasatospora sp. NPDC004669]|uniref:protease inhibitor I42 family protein n=1 Tax=Kitasatospora sp. NPDC004669 TaxID=3154555 RepID=UPI0033B7824D
MDPTPDAAVVTKVDEKLDVPDDAKNKVGAGGTRYYTFEAKGRGTTTITLFTCFRGLCHHPELIHADDREWLVRNTYTVTVR